MAPRSFFSSLVRALFFLLSWHTILLTGMVATAENEIAITSLERVQSLSWYSGAPVIFTLEWVQMEFQCTDPRMLSVDILLKQGSGTPEMVDLSRACVSLIFLPCQC